ncbi:putative Diguanylate cyclase [Mesotoga infera]|uniref:Putative Diguanylate cyclase n=1 Tax=Mesotoga infera TaxID=1236046 RepID=A0A7Z7PQU0_9BACT|nr:diguanylate cyclase [Mesotoga infera]SSC12108.1 putative Diguanylate cyclase [Mesotoga infera]
MKKIVVVACSNFQQEMLEISTREEFQALSFYFYPALCEVSPRSGMREILNDVLSSSGEKLHFLFAPRSCPILEHLRERPEITHIAYDFCQELLAPKVILQQQIKRNSYLVTDGWLSQWREHLRNWGFDPSKNSSFMSEFSTLIVHLKTGVIENPERELADFAKAVKLPTDVIDIGLDYVKNFVLASVYDTIARKMGLFEEAFDFDLHRQIANYAMINEVLMEIASLNSKNEVLEKISTLAEMLFAPEEVLFFEKFRDGWREIYSSARGSTITEEVLQIPENPEDIFSLECGRDLWMKVRHDDKLLGALKISKIAFPEYSDRYLPVLGNIRSVLGLSLSNAELLEELKTISLTDPLTGIYNRRGFFDKAKAEFLKASRGNKSLSLAVCDLDNLKAINDSFGHEVGDLVLKEVTSIVRDNIRESDVFGRFGGDEFIILFPGCDSKAALEVLDRIRVVVGKIKEPLLNGQELSLSFGLTTIREDTGSLEELVSLADRALYEAKNSGRNAIKFI